MYGYAASSSAATALTPFKPPPQTTNATGPFTQNAAVAQSEASTTGQAQSVVSQTMSALPQQMQAAASGGTSGNSSSGSSSTGTSSLLTMFKNFNTLTGPANLGGQASRTATSAGSMGTGLCRAGIQAAKSVRFKGRYRWCQRVGVRRSSQFGERWRRPCGHCRKAVRPAELGRSKSRGQHPQWTTTVTGERFSSRNRSRSAPTDQHVGRNTDGAHCRSSHGSPGPAQRAPQLYDAPPPLRRITSHAVSPDIPRTPSSSEMLVSGARRPPEVAHRVALARASRPQATGRCRGPDGDRAASDTANSSHRCSPRSRRVRSIVGQPAVGIDCTP